MTKPKSTNKTSNTLLYGCLALFGLPFALAGLAAAISVLQIGYDDLRIQFWTETPCEIVSVKLVEVPGDDAMLYRVTAEYRYQWQGATINGTRVSLMDRTASSNLTHYQKLFEELEQHRLNGQPVPCWVNSSLPSEAVLVREGQWGEVALMSLAAVMFGGVGFGLVGVVFFSWRDERRKPSVQDSTDKPWLSRSDWASGEIVHSDRKSGMIWNWVSGAMLLMSAPSMMISGRAVAAGNWLALLGLVPTAIALLTQWKARNLLSRWRCFGDSILKMSTIPGVIGGEFLAVICPERLTESPDGYQLRLTCTETFQSSGDDGPSTKSLWDEQRIVIRELSDDTRQLAIPVLFRLPFNAPTTELDPDRDKRTWKLSVKSLTEGHGYQSEFEVPICRTSDSQQNFKPAIDLQEYLAPRDPMWGLKAGGVIVEELDDGGCRMLFPRGRQLGFAIGMLFVQAVFVVAVTAGLYFYWKAGWMYVGAFLGFGFVWALLELLHHSEVVITRAGLEVRSGWFRLGTPQTASRSDIQDITLTAVGSVGNVTVHDIRALLKNKSSVLLAKRILPQTAAEQLKQRLLQLLRHDIK